MRLFILLFGLIFSINAFAGNGSANISSVIQLGANSIAPLGTATIPLNGQSGVGAIFSVYAVTFNPSPSANNVFPFYKNGAIWQVTGGKVAHCSSINYTVDTVNSYWQLMSDTVTFTDNATVGSLTAPRYQGGRTQAYIHRQFQTADSFAPTGGVYSFDSANAAFPGIQVGAAAGFRIIMSCYEI